ncbi:GNAT family N-acetyltransferase [candidate division WOR-3 bacterium]|nr:GNAT family N-acetyltransferase [candidate division WOR-3 bacterium]
MIHFVEAASDAQLREIRELFKEYADSLGFDLDFQNYADERASLPGEYKAPRGVLLLAYWDGEVAGCAALRPIDDEICEMKRMYVRPEYRGQGIGRQMAVRIIEFARSAGYKRMRLDTIDTMTEAITLYKSLGFSEIEPYCYNPLRGAKYMELVLH